jgi:hypothetical protein
MLTRLLFILMCAVPASAAPQERVLFDDILNMDQAGTWDRAVLVATGVGAGTEATKIEEFYQLAPGEQVDLLVYLNVGDGPLAAGTAPTVRKARIVDAEVFPFVLPMKSNAMGSLQVISSNGFGNTFNSTETLTIVHRKGVFSVAGYARDYYNSREDLSSHCSVNYLSKKAVTRKNQGKDVRLNIKVKPITLAQWSAENSMQICGED